MVRVGLIGCGTIGSQLALAVQRDYPHTARIAALHDIDRARAIALQRRLAGRPPIVPLRTLISKSHVVLEAASADAAAEAVTLALRAKRSVFIMSVGGLLRDLSWRRLAGASGARVYIPSGALAGLDGVKALAVGRLRAISLTTSKPPRALASAPYVRRRRLRLERLTRPRLIFEGSPEAAVRAFPQNTNVAAALTLAAHRLAGAPGRPARQAPVRIRVMADPTIRVNRHELDIQGDCARVRCRVESRPSANPKTSELAVRSAVATLGRIFDAVQLGT